MEYKLASSIQDIGEVLWRKLEAPNFPFFDYPFLKALEDSGSIGGRSGWDPIYLQVWDAAGLAGVLCGFIKSHSYGEYIFDWNGRVSFSVFSGPIIPSSCTQYPSHLRRDPGFSSDLMLMRNGYGNASFSFPCNSLFKDASPQPMRFSFQKSNVEPFRNRVIPFATRFSTTGAIKAIAIFKTIWIPSSARGDVISSVNGKGCWAMD